jgi:hypothetical protein
MGLFDKLFGKTNNAKQDKNTAPEHAVTIAFQYGIQELAPLHELEDKLEELLSDKGVGECDGHEIATDYSDGFLYLYGPNAENLFKVIQPLLESTNFTKGAVATLRFGPPEDGVKEIELIIGADKSQ